MKTKIYCPDIECDSCVKLLDKRLGKMQGVQDVKISTGWLEISYDQARVNQDDLIKTIEHAGFRASTDPFERKTLRERFRHFKERKDVYRIERNALKDALILFFILTALEAIAYLGFFRDVPGFAKHFFPWFFYLNLTIASMSAALFVFTSYKGKITCMTGMMIGMTFGMQTGMMLGAILGATNGFFIGALLGMLTGVLVGMIAGNCCGIMGIMEGMMAGVMGGTMGPMISVMMLSDHLHWFMPFYMAINLAIILGMLIMFHEEVVEGKTVETKQIDRSLFFASGILVTIVIIVIMVFGPQTPLSAFSLIVP